MKKHLLIVVIIIGIMGSSFAETEINIEIEDVLTGEYTVTTVTGNKNIVAAYADVVFDLGSVSLSPWIKGDIEIENGNFTSFFYAGFLTDFRLSDPFNINIDLEYYADLLLADNTEDEITARLGFYGDIGDFGYSLHFGPEFTFKGSSFSTDLEALLNINAYIPFERFELEIDGLYILDIGLSSTANIENKVTVIVGTAFPSGFTPSLGIQFLDIYSKSSSLSTEDTLSLIVGFAYNKGMVNLALDWQHGIDFQSGDQKGKYIITFGLTF